MEDFEREYLCELIFIEQDIYSEEINSIEYESEPQPEWRDRKGYNDFLPF